MTVRPILTADEQQHLKWSIMPLQKYCLKIIFLWKCLLIFTVYRINTSICLDHVLLCTLSPPFFYLVNGPLILTRYRGQVLTPGAAFPRGLDESLLLFTHYCFTSNHTTKHIPSLKQIKDIHQKLLVNSTVNSDIFFKGGVQGGGLEFQCFFLKYLIFMKYICLFKFRIQVENSSLSYSKFLNLKVNNTFFFNFRVSTFHFQGRSYVRLE